MGIQDRDWYKDRGNHDQAQHDQGVGSDRRVQSKASKDGGVSAWKIAAFWIVLALVLTVYFGQVIAEKKTKRMLKRELATQCADGSKCV